MKYYDKNNNRLVWEDEKASPDFWDEKWKREDLKKIVERDGKRDRLVRKITKKFFEPKKSVKILEGGCGMGHFVYSLDLAGFDAYGLDYAQKTIRKLKEIFPNLNFLFGDVRKLDFENNFFDGYWSLGVIEHFYEGYGQTALEMKRVLKPGGYLFITFPHLSILRKIKIKLGKYPIFNESTFNQERFYQFGLDAKIVINDFQKMGFKLVFKKSLDGVFGLGGEISFGSSLMKKLYGDPNLIFKILRRIINILISGFCGHIVLLVFRKGENMGRGH
jgi:SAM-dependent methyltransferase